MIEEIIKCHNCGSDMLWDTREESFMYKDEEFKETMPGWWCTGCTEAVFKGSDVKAAEPAWLEFKERVDNKTN